jgi:hypothetical protein
MNTTMNLNLFVEKKDLHFEVPYITNLAFHDLIMKIMQIRSFIICMFHTLILCIEIFLCYRFPTMILSPGK